MKQNRRDSFNMSSNIFRYDIFFTEIYLLFFNTNRLFTFLVLYSSTYKPLTFYVINFISKMVYSSYRFIFTVSFPRHLNWYPFTFNRWDFFSLFYLSWSLWTLCCSFPYYIRISLRVFVFSLTSIFLLIFFITSFWNI